MCCGISTYLKKNTRWWNVFKLGCVFAIIFGLGEAYFGLNDFTSFQTGSIISALISLVFTIFFATCSRFRCAAYVFVVECFSGLGVTCVFLAISWFFVSESLQGVLSNIKCIQTQDVGAANKTSKFLNVVKVASDIAGVLHYSFAVPFMFLFIHSLVYVCTYTMRKPRSGEKHKLNMQYALLNILRQVKGFIVGFLIALKFTLMFCQHLSYLAIDKQEGLVPVDIFWNSVYLVGVGILFILAPFSRKILKIRHQVVKSFFNTNNGVMSHVGHANIVMKPKQQRVNLSTIQEQKRNKRKNAQKKKTSIEVNQGDKQTPLMQLDAQALELAHEPQTEQRHSIHQVNVDIHEVDRDVESLFDSSMHEQGHEDEDIHESESETLNDQSFSQKKGYMSYLYEDN